MNLETDLKRALRPSSPAPGFSSRVMERIDRERSTPQRRPAHWRAIAAGMLLTAIVGSWGAHTIVERRQGQRAREEVLLAMNIAGAKVRVAQQAVRDIGSK